MKETKRNKTNQSEARERAGQAEESNPLLLAPRPFAMRSSEQAERPIRQATRIKNLRFRRHRPCCCRRLCCGLPLSLSLSLSALLLEFKLVAQDRAASTCDGALLAADDANCRFVWFSPPPSPKAGNVEGPKVEIYTQRNALRSSAQFARPLQSQPPPLLSLSPREPSDSTRLESIGLSSAG